MCFLLLFFSSLNRALFPAAVGMFIRYIRERCISCRECRIPLFVDENIHKPRTFIKFPRMLRGRKHRPLTKSNGQTLNILVAAKVRRNTGPTFNALARRLFRRGLVNSHSLIFRVYLSVPFLNTLNVVQSVCSALLPHTYSHLNR